MPDPDLIRVVLADDQPVLRTGLARILGPVDGFEVVAECGDGTEVASAVAAHRPDLVVMDARKPRMDGIAATAALRRLASPPAVRARTTFDVDEILWGLLDAGAAGFALKDAPATDLLAAARAVAGGGCWFAPAVAPRVLAAYRRHVTGGRREAARVEQLTEREHDVLRLMARGRTNHEVAAELSVSEATVKSHVSSLFDKLGARDRAAAIVYAYDHGIVVPGAG